MNIESRPSDGRERIRVYHDGRERYVYLYRLTAVAHGILEGLGDDRIVHHENGIPWDDRPANLEAYPAEDHPRNPDGTIA